MGSTSSSLLRSLSPFPFSPENPPLLLSLKPRPQTPPCQLPLPSLSSTNPPAKPHQLTLNPLQKPPEPSSTAIGTNPLRFFDPDVFPVSLESVICPSLAYANVYFFKPYNVQVTPREDEEVIARLADHQGELSADRIVKRFRNAAANAGVFYELKRRRFFESPREKRKTKAQRAAKVLKRAKIRAGTGRGLTKPRITIHRDPLEEKKRKARLAAKRPAKQKRAGFLKKQKGSNENSSVPTKQKESYNSDDDNWEFEGIELPYC